MQLSPLQHCEEMIMLDELMKRYPSLSICTPDIEKAAQAMIDCYTQGGKVMTCGNGGSCADADHIVGELMKGFLKKRPLSVPQKQKMKANYPETDDQLLEALQYGLPALSLCSLTALNTAFSNDVDPDLTYAQSVFSLGKNRDVLICLSTSGNAKNVCSAAIVAKSLGITVIGLTGRAGGRLKEIADFCIIVPETETFKIQELHLPVYHYLCAETEAHFFPA